MDRAIKRILISAACLIGAPIFAMPLSGKYNPHFRRFDLHLIKLMKEYHIPGASVAVAKDGKVIYQRGFGYADIAKKEQVTSNSMFRLASTSKTLTAIGMLKLIESGKIGFNTKVFPYLGLHPLPGDHKARGVDGITVKNLLEMSSGWSSRYDPMFGPWPVSEVRKYHLHVPMSCETAARYMMGRDLRFTPGRTFGYENINYCLLGLVIAKASSGALHESAYEHYMQRLFHSVGVYGMYLGSTNPHKIGKNEVHYYRVRAKVPTRGDGYIRVNDFPYGYDHILEDNYPNAGWVATAPDLAKFLMAVEEGQVISRHYSHYLWNAPKGKAHRYHSIHGVKYMKWPYTMGMWRIQYDWTVLDIAHGSFTGTNTMIIRKPDDREVDVILFNERPGYNMSDLWVIRQKLIKMFDRYG